MKLYFLGWNLYHSTSTQFNLRGGGSGGGGSSGGGGGGIDGMFELFVLVWHSIRFTEDNRK